jgi:hypothetical protein
MDVKKSDGWDWRWLYYTGTVLLNMTEERFWRTTPRTLNALSKVYIEQNGLGETATATNPKLSPFGTPYGFID